MKKRGRARSKGGRSRKKALRRNIEEEVDVAVIGAGVAGTYCCWRLQEEYKKNNEEKTVVLYEMSNWIGGRLLSVKPPDMPHLRGELGGMRFLRAQKLVDSLVSHLGLKTDPFPKDGRRNFSRLRGVRLTLRDFKKRKKPFKVPYLLDWSRGERGLAPFELLEKAITTVVKNAKELTPKEWERVKQKRKWKGLALYKWGLWNMLAETLSPEAYALLMDGGGYESLVDNWNCAEACEYLLMDFPTEKDKKVYRRLTGGFQELPKKLASEFKAKKGEVRRRHKLCKFTANKKFVLLDIENVAKKDKKECFRVKAKALILAMPKKALELLENDHLKDKKVKNLLDSVQAMPAFKVLLGYSKPWWKKQGLSAGRSTTDLPVRQVYYVGSENAYDAGNTNSLLLAAYADGRAETFWHDLEDPKTRAQPWAEPVFFRRTPRRVRNLIETLREQLAQMHDREKTPEPFWGAYMDWTLNPYGGGWHFWNPGVKVWETIKKVRQPINGVPVYICGEAYANQQGWVEGALTSAEHVLEEYFHLNRPDWLPTDYSIGP